MSVVARLVQRQSVRLVISLVQLPLPEIGVQDERFIVDHLLLRIRLLEAVVHPHAQSKFASPPAEVITMISHSRSKFAEERRRDSYTAAGCVDS